MAKALYVVNFDASTVTVYEPGSRRVERTLTAPQMLGPTAVAFDTVGNTYVASSGGGSSEVLSAIFVYRPGGTKPYKTITSGIDSPYGLAFDSSGNLYVANLGFANPPSIAVFSPGADTPSRTIYAGIYNPVCLTFDHHGDLYVTNHSGAKRDRGSVVVFPPGTSEPSLTIERGIGHPNQALLDAEGNLYVANDDSGISIYKPGRSQPAKVIDPQHSVGVIELDGRDNLYEISNLIIVYRPGKTKPSKVVQNKASFSAAFDGQFNLFVGDNPPGCRKAGKLRNDGCVRVFQHGSLEPLYQINEPGTPYALGFGPP